MSGIVEKSKCTGCTACEAVCPMGCIKMKRDEEGFLIPDIDKEKCIQCGKCKLVCPVLNTGIVNKTDSRIAYAAINLNDEIRAGSTSGGVFSVICEWIIEHEGVIYGAVYDADFSVRHTKIENKLEISRLRTAKYVQSNLQDIFLDVKKMLEQQKYVLFSGTPCQVNGLRLFLKKRYDKLLLVDLICHGVPSPQVWNEYLKYRRMKDAAGARIKQINMRKKKPGWYDYSMEIIYENEVSYNKINQKDPFLKSFVGDMCLRESCYQCPCKGINRNSDFTLGDYWGVWEELPSFYDNKGTSIVILQSTKAKRIWEQLKKNFRTKEISLDECKKNNPAILKSVLLPETRTVFMKNYDLEDFEKLVEQLSPRKKKDLLERLKRIMKRIMKRIVIRRC